MSIYQEVLSIMSTYVIEIALQEFLLPNLVLLGNKNVLPGTERPVYC